MTVMHRRASLDVATEVDLLGTDSTAFLTSTLHFDVRAWEHVNLVDLSFALTARRKSVPLVAIPRAKGWVHPLAERQDDSIWLGVRRDDTKQTALAQELVGLPRPRLAPPEVAGAGISPANVDSPAMPGCPSCGFENSDTAKFCSECGAAFSAPATVRREERKVVTVFFVDLVGFTARAEQLDPEDVRAILAPLPRARCAPSSSGYGGTVEKFIGDAVDGRLRRAGRARGRSRARGACGARDP